MVDTTAQPLHWVRDNIAVNESGMPVGIWYVTGQPYSMAPSDEKEAARSSTQDLYQSLTGEYDIYGLVATTPPEKVIEQMLEGIDDPSKQWLKECDLTYQALTTLPAGERAYFIVAPLTSSNPRELWDRGIYKATTTLQKFLGLALSRPKESTFEAWKARARSIQEKIPGIYQPRPAGILSIRWITEHLTTRGAEASEAFAFKEIENSDQWINAVACLPEPALDEGNFEEIALSKTAKAKLFKRRYVKVTRHDKEPSFQQFACLAMTPQAGYIFPGSEFINLAAGMPQDIDFCIRIKSSPADEAKERNSKSERNLHDQYEQHTGDDGITGGHSELDKSAKALRDYVTALNATDREVEIQATIIFASSGPTAEAAVQDMKALTDFYNSEEWVLDIPFGGQEKLFWDFWPGSSPSEISSEYTQLTTGRDFSMGIPFANDELGMKKGFRAAINITSGRHSSVLMDLAGLAENDVSGSFACVGELGSGKSVAMKTIASHSIDRGAQLVAVDHSDNQEWAALAKALTTANVIDFLKPTQSLDPLRIWTTDEEKKRQTLNLITMMLGTDPSERSYALLFRELDRLFKAEEHGINTLRDLVDHFEFSDFAERDLDTARFLADRLNIFAKLDFARTFFDPALPLLDFSYQATVFCTHGMELPNQDELYGSVQGLDLAKRMGRAAYAYLAEIGSHIMYEDDSQEVLFLIDEAHHMTSSPEGSATIKKGLKTGRKHKSAVGLASHSADELGDVDLRGLIPQRFVFRTRDVPMARKNLNWLDTSYASKEYIEMLTKHTAPMDSTGIVPEHRRGECLYRDPLNRIGKIKFEIPLNPVRQKTVLTSPPKRGQKAQPEVVITEEKASA
jgi:hypothetical protein